VLIEDAPVAAAARHTVPALIAAAAVGWLTAAMTPLTFAPGGDAWSYRITQPSVIARYFRVFFAPYDLSADTDRRPIDTLFNGQAIFGFLFVAALIAVAIYCARRREQRPIAFGLMWFLLALLPTSVQPLSEVENDHRIFFPFVGLAIAVVWAGALWLYSRPFPARAVAALCGVVLLGFSWGTRERNKVWHDEESLWLDVTQKSPANGRGLMNYGLSQMAKGEYTRALDYFRRALVFSPDYYVLEVNLGIDLGQLHRDAEAEQHFRRAAVLNPLEAVSHFFYGRWLYGRGRTGDAIEQLNTVIRNNPDYIDAPHLLMEIYAQLGNQELLRRTATETLARFPADAAAASWLARAATLKPTPESYVNQSLAYYQQGRFTDAIHAAEEALKLRPGYALAWNNIAAAWNAMGKWDEGIAAGEKAVRAAPDNQLARNNLAWARRQKALGVASR
jgi:tetratricopeptide (TPR) repeat protein